MRPPATEFLHRKSYRRRRMADAARLLPLAGIILLIIPLLLDRSGASATGARTSSVVLYIFAIWAALILAAYGLSFWLGGDEDGARDGKTSGSEDGP